MVLLSLFWTTGPCKRFPVSAVTDILKDVLTSYLQEEKYEVEWSQKMAKTICEVNKSHLCNTLRIPWKFCSLSVILWITHTR